MRTILLATLLAGCGAGATASTSQTVVLADGPGPGDEAPPEPTVTGAQARELVAQGAVLLDVSRAEIHAAAPLPGSINIPRPELATRWGELPMDRLVVVYCERGRGSPYAYLFLVERGFRAELLGARARWYEADAAPATR
jgi:rhodanese-related sulfurtransferase